MRPLLRLPLFLRLYPLALALGAVLAFGFCQWFHIVDLSYAEIWRRLSLKLLLTACPQLLAAVLLLYYALTFNLESSAFAHRMLIESCPHQTVLSLLIVSLVRASLDAGLSLCCFSPSHCPIDVESCHLTAILQCPAHELEGERFRLYARLAQFFANWLLVAALMSIGTAHTMRDMHLRFRQPEFIAFERRQEELPAAVAVKL